jgi:hypothetical protein
LGDETIRIAYTYEMRYGPEPNDVVYYFILAEGEHISKEDDPLILPGELEFKKEIVYNDKNLALTFFKHFWPCLVGQGKSMDKYFDKINAPHYATVKTLIMNFMTGELMILIGLLSNVIYF